MIAIIRTGGKQYKVTEGQKLKVEKLEAEIGATLKLETLFVGDEKTVSVGRPVLEKAVVEAKITSAGLGEKVKGIYHKAKKRELTRFGHRQPFTEIQIVSIKA